MRNLKFIIGSILSYCYIMNSPERLEQIRQAKTFAYVLCDLESDTIIEKQDKKKRVMEAEENRRQKYEQKHGRENEDRLRGPDRCEALVCSVLTFGMYHINKTRFKEILVFLFYHFGSERLKGIRKKVELVEAVTGIFQGEWEGIMDRVELGGRWKRMI